MLKKILLLLVAAITMFVLLTPQAIAQVRGDIDGDDDVDIYDVILAAGQYAINPNDPAYNSTVVSKADLAPPYNGILDILDIVTLASCYTGSR